MFPFKSENITIASGRNKRHQNISTTEVQKIDTLPATHMDSITTMNTHDLYDYDSENMRYWSGIRFKFRCKKVWASVRQLWQTPKGLSREPSDPDWVKVAYGVAKSQEYAKHLASEVESARAHADELEDTLVNERQRFQQTLEAQRNDYKERVESLKQQLETLQSRMVVVDAWLRVARQERILSDEIRLDPIPEDEVETSE